MRADKYRIITAPGGEDALQLLGQQPVDVILSDHRMPGMTGVEFLRAAKEQHPDTLRILLSGYPNLHLMAQAVNEGSVYRFLTKPWDETQLRLHVAEAFEAQRLAQENWRLNAVLRAANKDLAISNYRLASVAAQMAESDSLDVDGQ